MKNEIPVCALCGADLGQLIGDTIDYFDDYTGSPVCRSCIIEHCCTTNCLGCEIGTYPDCEYLKIKHHYMQEEMT